MTFESILGALPDAAVVLGPGGVVEYLNPAAVRLCGWTQDDAQGRHWGEVLPLRDAAGFLLHETSDPFAVKLQTIVRTPEREYLLRRRDGAESWVAICAAYERNGDGQVQRVVASVRDIARRRRIDRAKSDLISTVSHEIRSPLTSVKGFTSTLLHRWDRFNDDQKKHMLRTVNADADRVTRLLTDLLDVARLESGRFELRRQLIRVPQIAAAAAERLQIEHQDRPISINFAGVVPEIWGDPGKVEQVVINLVENALKYATKGPILIAGEFTDEHVTVRVTDEGVGIDAKHVPHLFQKFYRRQHSDRTGGTGLGLYICHGIIAAHGGKIWVERSDASGTVFTFTLPKGEPPA